MNKYIAFDGPDGAGKTTQVARLSHWFRDRGHDVTEVREPGGTELGEKLRSLILSTNELLSHRSELLLLMAARAQLIDQVVRPALDRGNGSVVVSDRSILSSFAYQGQGLEKQITDIIFDMGSYAVDRCFPDLTIVFSLPRSVALGRLGEKRDRIEARGEAYHEKVHRVFDDLVTHFGFENSRYPGKIVAVDASLDVDTVQREVLTHILG